MIIARHTFFKTVEDQGRDSIEKRITRFVAQQWFGYTLTRLMV